MKPVLSEMVCAGALAGAVVIHDKLKPEARAAVRALQAKGVRVALLTGDNRRTALAIAEDVGESACH